MFTVPYRTALLAATLSTVAACVPFDARTVSRAPVATPPAAEEPRLKAAESRIAAGDLGQARATLQQVQEAQLEPLQRTYRQILEAELALAEDRPLQALQVLPRFGKVTDAGLAARIEEDRARAQFRIGDAIGATDTLRRRGTLLADPAFQAHNRELLWSELRRADLDAVPVQLLHRAEPETRGWIELAAIARAVWTPPQTLPNRLREWNQEYPGHPASGRLAEIEATPAPRSGVRQVALLLPLTGPYAATGEAVRDGFLSAYYQVVGSPLTAKVYDTGSTVDTFRLAWLRALNEGAEFAIGPLRRDMVNALATDGRPAIPVLALNYLDAGVAAPFNFFQWGLAPEDEARQAAERAAADGQVRAVTLVPEGDWGARILQAFRERYEALGGRVVAEQSYQADTRDHSDAIRTLLALDWSEERHRTLTVALGVKTEFEPRRRRDVDMVFMAARPDQARLLGPQLRFHRTGALPVYTTASIYDGGELAMDLNGLRFCDMPWMLASAGAADERWALERAQLGELFPQHRSDYARLLGLGRDAFTLVHLIGNGQMQPGNYIPAASGSLTLGTDGVIRRRLSCVEINRGELTAVAPAAASAR